MNPAEKDSGEDGLRETAAGWVVRRDRGLSAAESVEFELWLAADKRHAEAMQHGASAWSRLDRLPESVAGPILAAATKRRSFWRKFALGGSFAAVAAAVALVGWIERSPIPGAAPTANLTDAPDSPRQLTLSDGSVVELNRGSEVAEQFTAAERGVRLVRGEAHFSVTKNPARPFVVRAAHVEVRAVGTAFDVHLESAAVEVLVTEGVVKLNPSADGAVRRVPAADSIPSLNPGQRAMVALAPASPEVAVVVTTVSREEIAHTLAWQEPLLRLGGATLAEVVANFERRTGRRVILADPALAQLRLGGRFRPDDLEGFASVLADTLDVEIEHAPDGVLVVRKKNASSR